MLECSIEQTLFICLLLLLHCSIVTPPQGFGLNPPQDISHAISSIPALQTTQQNLFNRYITNPPGPLFNRASSQEEIVPPAAQNIDEKNAEILRQKHSQLINGYFDNKSTENIDNGANNTIEGIRNVIEFGNTNKIDGNENRLNGSKNLINGSGNDVKGDDNSINSKNNVVYGNGNQISDTPFTPKAKTQIQTTPSSSKTNINTDTSSSSQTETVNNNNLSHQFEKHTVFGVIFILFLVFLQ